MTPGCSLATLVSIRAGDLRLEEPGKAGHRLPGCQPCQKKTEPDCQPEAMNQNDQSESFVRRRRGRFFFFCRKCVGEHEPCWTGSTARSLPGNPHNPILHASHEVPSASAVLWLIEKASAQPPDGRRCLPTSAWLSGNRCPWWCHPRHDRGLPGEAVVRDALSKATEVALGPGSGLEEAFTLSTLILGSLGVPESTMDQQIKRSE